jgi:DnaK suppressor protein
MVDLTESQLAKFRAELERQLAKLKKSMTVTDESLKTVELDQAAVGRLSRMDSLQNQALAKGLRERENARLNFIQEAIRRLAAGTYGVCIECGGRVAVGRLFVFPESGTCASCGD